MASLYSPVTSSASFSSFSTASGLLSARMTEGSWIPFSPLELVSQGLFVLLPSVGLLPSEVPDHLGEPLERVPAEHGHVERQVRGVMGKVILTDRHTVLLYLPGTVWKDLEALRALEHQQLEVPTHRLLVEGHDLCSVACRLIPADLFRSDAWPLPPLLSVAGYFYCLLHLGLGIWHG